MWGGGGWGVARISGMGGLDVVPYVPKMKFNA